MLTTFNELKVSVRITFLKIFGKVRHMKSVAAAFPRKIDIKWRDHVINDGLAHTWKLILQRGKIRHCSKGLRLTLYYTQPRLSSRFLSTLAVTSPLFLSLCLHPVILL